MKTVRLMRGVAEQQSRGGAEQTVTVLVFLATYSGHSKYSQRDT